MKGVYFIRTNHENHSESQLWALYDTIREVESTFRCLKTDLNMRPVYHQLDERIKAHLFLTTLAYQLVNTIRFMLKQNGIILGWQYILRLMSTQVMQTTVFNTDTKTMHIRKPSTPSKDVEAIYQACKCNKSKKAIRKYVVYH